MAVSLLLACGGGRTAPQPLELVVPQEPATLDPRYATRSHDVKITRLVHAGLFGLSPDSLEPYPLLAASYVFHDPAHLEVTLKPGITFHSGKTLHAEDVCATIRAVSDATLGSPHRAVVKTISKCTTSGADRVHIELGSPRATLLTDLELPILRADQAGAKPAPDGQLDGLGPYRITGVSDGAVTLTPQSTGLVPRPRHELVVRTVRDENARALRLLAGRSDIAPNAISPTLLPALEGRPDLTVTARPGANVTYLLMHNERAPLDRKEVRFAIAQAIDRSAIVSSLFAGRAQVADSLLPPGHWAHAPTRRALSFDAAAARPVLAELPKLTLLTGTDRLRVTVSRAIAQMLGDAGLRIQVVGLDFGVLLARIDGGDYELALLQMPELTEPNLLHWFFHRAGVPGEGGEGRNRARYRSPEASALLELASRSNTRSERQQLYAHLLDVMSSDMPVVPLWHEDQIAVVSARARGFRLSAEGRWSSVAALP